MRGGRGALVREDSVTRKDVWAGLHRTLGMCEWESGMRKLVRKENEDMGKRKKGRRCNEVRKREHKTRLKLYH